jgi:hypothetical protein
MADNIIDYCAADAMVAHRIFSEFFSVDHCVQVLNKAQITFAKHAIGNENRKMFTMTCALCSYPANAVYPSCFQFYG